MYLDTGSMNQPTVTMSMINSWASKISEDHLSSGIDPTDGVVKIAEANGLTPHQVEVLSGETNKKIHIEKFAKVDDKYHAADFPLADSREVIRRLQVDSDSEKVASVNCDGDWFGEMDKFAMPDPKVDVDWNALYGVEPETIEKTASANRTELNNEFQKLASMKDAQDEITATAEHAAGSAEVAFIKSARQHALSGLDSNDRLKKLADVAHLAECCDLYPVAKAPLAKLAYALGQEGLVDPRLAQKATEFFMDKKADQTAPDYLISDWLNSRVVNGNNPLVITLKTYADCRERAEAEAQRSNLVDDKVRIYAQKIRSL